MALLGRLAPEDWERTGTHEARGPLTLREVVARLVEHEEERSDSWYLVAHDSNGDYLTLDCGRERAGRCYDSVHEMYGLVGQTPVIARSFTELLTRCYDTRGGYSYWLRAGFVSLGDAYDE